MTFCIITLSITTPSIAILDAIMMSVIMLSVIYAKCCKYALYAEWHLCHSEMSVIILNAVILSVMAFVILPVNPTLMLPTCNSYYYVKGFILQLTNIITTL
jgi:hypothetical protein